MKRNTTLTALAVCASAVVGLGALGNSAQADPIGAPAQRVLVAQGSDTTQDVMNGFADAIVANGTDYKATGLLHDATVIGDTTVKTSLLPTAGSTITIDSGANAETVTVSAITATASAFNPVGPVAAVNFNTLTITPALTKAHAVNAIVVGAAVPAGTKVLASYNAVGGAFQSKANPNCQYVANNAAPGNNYTGTTQNGAAASGANTTFLSGGRANGSGVGASSLGDSFTPTSALWGCTDVGRASSKRSNVTGLGAGNAVNIPFAIDAVDFAVTTTSNFSRKLGFDALKAIYRCTFPGMIPATQNLGGLSAQDFAAANGLLYATIPQAGSGTRAFVVGALGLTESTTVASGNTGAACITDKTPTGGVLEEHDLRTLDDNGIGVTSVAQSITQRAQAVAGVSDKQGRTVLVAVDNRSAANGGPAGAVGANNGKLNYAVTMSNQFGGGTGNAAGALVLWRDVFNVVPLSRLADPNIQAAFVGAGSSVCTDATGVLAQYGFAPNPSCGITTNVG